MAEEIEIKTVGDILRKVKSNINSDFVYGEVSSRVVMNSDSKYAYCPYCLKDAMQRGQDYKTWLRPLWRTTYKNLYKMHKDKPDDPDVGKIIYETLWECQKCKDAKGNPRQLTPDDFSNCYSQYWKKDKNGSSGYDPDKHNQIPLDDNSIRKYFKNYKANEV